MAATVSVSLPPRTAASSAARRWAGPSAPAVVVMADRRTLKRLDYPAVAVEIARAAALGCLDPLYPDGGAVLGQQGQAGADVQFTGEHRMADVQALGS